jgi:hypothetical protein
MKTITRTLKDGTTLRRVRRGLWDIMETRGGVKTGRASFAGTLAECRAAIRSIRQEAR